MQLELKRSEIAKENSPFTWAPHGLGTSPSLWRDSGDTPPLPGARTLLRFRFAPRVRDLADRRLYVADGGATHAALAGSPRAPFARG